MLLQSNSRFIWAQLLNQTGVCVATALPCHPLWRTFVAVGKKNIIQLIYLHPIVLRVAVCNDCDWRADPVIYSHSNFRKAAYRQYILRVYGRIGRGNRHVATSCVVNRISSCYPSSDGTYMEMCKLLSLQISQSKLQHSEDAEAPAT